MLHTIRKPIILKTLAAWALSSLGMQLLWPTAAWALTAGPSSPEFGAFTPVATTDMVNHFTGDFTYNLPVLEIPGPDGGGYALSLAYTGEVSSEQESSWVGLGWSPNPNSLLAHRNEGLNKNGNRPDALSREQGFLGMKRHDGSGR